MSDTTTRQPVIPYQGPAEALADVADQYPGLPDGGFVVPTGADLWVLTIEHRHGFDTTVHANEASAMAWLADYVADQWDVEADRHSLGERPENPSEAIEVYFEGVEDEYWMLAATAILNLS